MTENTWDAIIIGGGTAGLSAAQTLGRALRRTLVIDAGDPRNRFAAHIHNVLGLDGKTPEERGEIGRAEAAEYGVEFRSGRVHSVTEVPGGLRVALAGDGADEALDTRALIVATGVTVVADGVARITGEGAQVSAVITERGDAYPVDAVFSMSSMQSRDGFLANLELERSDQALGSFLVTDALGQTSHPRVWAAGNVVQPAATVPVSMGAGVMAAGAANFALVEEDYARAAAEASSERVPGHQHGPGATSHGPHADAAEFWEGHYGAAGPVWSGEVNATLAHAVAELAPGRALDLGSGEGGDAIWLAQQGWQTTGIDISATAVARATAAAAAAGLSEDQARFVVADLTALNAVEAAGLGLPGMNLVTASFFQSPLELDRGAIFRAAAALVAAGGHLVIVAHAAPPSWADIPEGMEHKFPSPEDELAGLALGGGGWRTMRAEVVARDIVDLDGRPATIDDTLVVLQRVAG